MEWELTVDTCRVCEVSKNILFLFENLWKFHVKISRNKCNCIQCFTVWFWLIVSLQEKLSHISNLETLCSHTYTQSSSNELLLQLKIMSPLFSGPSLLVDSNWIQCYLRPMWEVFKNLAYQATYKIDGLKISFG